MDPLVDFAIWGKDAPFLAKRPKYDYRALVVPVRSKTGIVAARRGSIAHLDVGIAAVIRNGRARFAARFLCGGHSLNAGALANADAYGGICAVCADAKLGPGVYRFLNAAERVIYIGSSEKPLKRQMQHRSKSPWWPEVAEVQVTRYPTIFEASAAERIAQDAEEPIHNRPRNGPRRRHAAA